MLYFAAKKEEVGAVKLFRKNCTYHGLDVHLSLNAMLALKLVVESNLQNVTAGINDRDTNTLQRRGLVRITGEGEVRVTEMGLLVVALGEAADLISVKGTK